jgi:AcrR family transcriptional regulator
MTPRATTDNARALTRESVIDAAAELVAEHGYAGLNMRALADRCGVATMTLYRHVRTKEDMLGALADRLFEELELPEQGGSSWQEDIATVLRSMHRLLTEHPELAEIAARQHINGVAAYRGAEVVLDALRRAGIEGEAAASAFAALVAFTVGFALQQIHSSSSGQLGERLALLEDLPPEEFPNVTRLGSKLLVRDSDRHFERGLSFLLSGFESQGKA